jgi:hypothetical protein
MSIFAKSQFLAKASYNDNAKGNNNEMTMTMTMAMAMKKTVTRVEHNIISASCSTQPS